MKKLLLITLAYFYFSSCSAPQSGSTTVVSPVSCSTTVAEVTDCTTHSVHASPVTITGTAQFFKRRINVTGTAPNVTSLTLGAPITTALPIKFAEIRVLNASGSIVQCGKTNSSGAIKALDGLANLEIPNTAGNYTVEVLAKSNHNLDVSGNAGKPAFKLYASVKKDICSNGIHSISKVVSSSGSGTINLATNDLTAYARESETSNLVQGGAFNILNNLVSTYEYIATNTGTSDISCLSPKLSVYWQSGFNPAQYLSPSADPSTLSNISFYLRGYSELYINGGKLGNVTTADTDHFDDAVIIHEIGHRIEDACGKMDSPGGSHNGLFRIDPRLAWSEGWGNFLGAHIFRNQIASINPQANTALTTFDGWLYYLDTNGYSDSGGTASELIRLSLKKPGNNPDIYSDTNSNGVCDATEYCYDKVDAAANPGEGHFREVSIARALFKSTNTCTGGTCTNTNYFAKIWEAFEKNPAGVGMGKSAYYFRSSVRFYDRMAATSGGVPVAIDTILNSDEAQQRNGNASYTPANLIWPSYGIKLVPTMVACNLEIEPRNQSALTTNQQPDQRYSSHFYYLDKATSLAGVTSFTLNTTFVAGTALSFGMRAYSDGYTFDTSNTSYTASIATGTLASSTPYILNIKAFTGSITVSPTTRYTYTLTTNNAGEFLCPSPTF